MNISSSTRLVLALSAIVLATTPARAESYDATSPAAHPDYYAGTVGELGFDGAVRLGLGLEAGHRLGASVFARAQVSSGTAGWGLGSRADYLLARAGVESRHCVGRSDGVCGFIGVDAGVVRYRGDDATALMADDSVNAMLFPRVGVELGQRLRVRAAVEAPRYLADGLAADAFGLQVGVGVAFVGG